MKPPVNGVKPATDGGATAVDKPEKPNVLKVFRIPSRVSNGSPIFDWRNRFEPVSPDQPIESE